MGRRARTLSSPCDVGHAAENQGVRCGYDTWGEHVIIIGGESTLSGDNGLRSLEIRSAHYHIYHVIFFFFFLTALFYFIFCLVGTRLSLN